MFKKLLRGLFLVIAVAIFTLPSFAQTGDTFRIKAQTLNARSGPGIEYEIVARLGRGGSYPILQYSVTRNWVLLDLGFGQAWAFRHLGEVSGTVPPLTMNTTTVTTSTTSNTFVDPSLGQGGGFAAPVVTVNTTILTTTETGVDLSVTQTQDQFNSTVGVTGSVRIRSAPTFNSRILAIMPFDERATPIGRNAMGTWIQVNFDGTVGWVYFLYVAFPPAIDVTTLPVTG